MKKKIVLLCTCAITSLAAIGGIALVTNNEFNANQVSANTDFTYRSETLVKDGDNYVANSVDDKGNVVRTKFSGFNVSNSEVKTYQSMMGYLTNLDAMRGIESISFSFVKETETAHNLSFALYASSNPLTIDDIYSGKHTDLFFSGLNKVGDEGTTVNRSYHGLGNYRYFLMEVFGGAESYTLESLTYDVVCSKEPTVVDIETRTAWTEAELKRITDAGAPATFPYPGTNGYLLSTSSMVTVNAIMKNANLGSVVQVIMGEGYVQTAQYNVDGQIVYYFQKQVTVGEDTVTLTYGLMMNMLSSTYCDAIYMYTDTFPYMGGETSNTWPKEAIAEVSTNLANAFPDFQLDGASYQYYGDEVSSSGIEVMVLVSGENNLNELATAYFNALDTTLYNINTSSSQLVATTKDGRYSLQVFLMGNQLGVTLIEKVVYDHFPVNELAADKGYSFPTFTDVVEGTFTIQSTVIDAPSLTESQLAAIIKLFTDIGYEAHATSETHTYLACPGHSTYDYDNIQIGIDHDTENGSYRIYFAANEKRTFSSLSEALAYTGASSDSQAAAAPVGYTGTITAIRYNRSYIEGATEQTILDIYNSIDAEGKSISGNTITYKVTIDDQLYTVYIGYALVDGVLYFDSFFFYQSNY